MALSCPLGTTCCLLQENSVFFSDINALITKLVPSRWGILASFFFNFDSVSVHKQAKKELGQYPTILISRLAVNKPYVLFQRCSENVNFLVFVIFQVGYMKHLARMMRHFISLVLWPFFLLWCSLASIAWYEISLKQARLSSTRRPRTTLRYFVVITPRPPTPVIRTRRPNRCWEMNVVIHLSTWKLANYLWWLTEKPFYSIELEESSNHSHLLLFLLSKASCTVRRGKCSFISTIRPTLIRQENGAFPENTLQIGEIRKRRFAF